jgi:hypothetical protein
VFSILLTLINVFTTDDTNLCFRLFTSNRNILISFLTFDFFWGSYLFSVLTDYYRFDGMQYLCLPESSMEVFPDEGTSFTRNVCNNSSNYKVSHSRRPESFETWCSERQILAPYIIPLWKSDLSNIPVTMITFGLLLSQIQISMVTFGLWLGHIAIEMVTNVCDWVTPRLLFSCPVCEWVTSRLP